MTLRDKIFSFHGRLRRRDYWLISISLGVATFVLTHGLILALFGPTYSIFTGGFAAVMAAKAQPGIEWLTVLVSVITLWPSMAMSAKRAHDRGQSARVVIALLVLFGVFNLVSPLMGQGDPAMLLFYGLAGLAIIVAAIYLFVVVGCLDGTPGPNRYGASPKGIGGDGDFASTFD